MSLDLTEIDFTENSNGRKILKFPHCVNSRVAYTQCGNFGNSLSHFFDKNFVKATVLLNKLLKSWFHETFFQWERISQISTLCVADLQNM